MERREFLHSFQQKKNVKNTVNVRVSASGLTPYSGEWNKKLATHLLKRTMFGAKKLDIDYFKNKNMSDCVNELINTIIPTPNPPVNNYSSTTADPDISAGATWINAPSGATGSITNNRRYSLQSWWLGLQINQVRSLEEKMVLFWHNHLVTEYPGIDPRHLYTYNVTLRKNALGNFKTLIKEITLNAAMLVYLNGNKNTAGAPNENYGRELQELFTMGKGTKSLYTESDVQAAAKVLTGFSYNSTTFKYTFTASKHDSSNKQFSAFYDNTIITGRTGISGEYELDDLLDMLFRQEELSMFICRKLYRFFVYYQIDETIETNVIAPLAKIFRDNNYEIKPVLSALFKSEHFYDNLNIACLIKSPLDSLVGLCREFNVIFPNAESNYVETYALWRVLITSANAMGQELGNPPNVAGWPAYYQEPQYHQLWINSNSLPQRNKFTDTIITNGYSKSGKKIVIDPIAFASTLDNPSDPNLLINESLEFLFMIELSQTSKDYLKTQILLSGQSTDGYWTTAWNNYISAPTNTSYKNVVFSRLQALYKYLMDLSEYQLS